MAEPGRKSCVKEDKGNSWERKQIKDLTVPETLRAYPQIIYEEQEVICARQ